MPDSEKPEQEEISGSEREDESKAKGSSSLQETEFQKEDTSDSQEDISVHDEEETVKTRSEEAADSGKGDESKEREDTFSEREKENPEQALKDLRDSKEDVPESAEEELLKSDSEKENTISEGELRSSSPVFSVSSFQSSPILSTPQTMMPIRDEERIPFVNQRERSEDVPEGGEILSEGFEGKDEDTDGEFRRPDFIPRHINETTEYVNAADEVPGILGNSLNTPYPGDVLLTPLLDGMQVRFIMNRTAQNMLSVFSPAADARLAQLQSVQGGFLGNGIDVMNTPARFGDPLPQYNQINQAATVRNMHEQRRFDRPQQYTRIPVDALTPYPQERANRQRLFQDIVAGNPPRQNVQRQADNNLRRQRFVDGRNAPNQVRVALKQNRRENPEMIRREIRRDNQIRLAQAPRPHPQMPLLTPAGQGYRTLGSDRAVNFNAWEQIRRQSDQRNTKIDAESESAETSSSESDDKD